jgi:hypothetical protein
MTGMSSSYAAPTPTKLGLNTNGERSEMTYFIAGKKFIGSVVDTSEQLIACVNDTGEQFISGVIDTGDKIFPRCR